MSAAPSGWPNAGSKASGPRVASALTPPSPRGRERDGTGRLGERVEGLGAHQRAVGHDDEGARAARGVGERGRERGGVPAARVHEHVDVGRSQLRSGVTSSVRG